MELSYKKRIRVNFDCSTKGKVTPSVTVEMIDSKNEEVLIEATKTLDAALVIAKERTDQNG